MKAGQPAHTPSPTRWYIATVYSLLAFIQGVCSRCRCNLVWLPRNACIPRLWCAGGQWNYPGPIGPTLEAAYGLDDAAVQLLLNYGPTFGLIVMLPSSFAMATPTGLRSVLRVAAVSLLASAALRFACRSPSAASVAALHLSFVANAIAGPAAMAAPTALAEVWFPATERATATAVMAGSNILGGCLSSIGGPLLVPTGSQREFDRYNAIYVALAAMCTMAVCAYWPVQPPVPPSASAAGEMAGAS